MSRTLLRSCLGCGTSVRGHPRCRDCQTKRDQAKAARRPDLKRAAQTRRRREAVADHRATIGDWCPGWERHGAHPSADLTADHVTEVAAGGPEDGPLVVRCRSCNAARSANVRRVVEQLLGSPQEPAATTPRPPNFPTQSG
jgi:5-methylcytosine-specific restriction protein A